MIVDVVVSNRCCLTKTRLDVVASQVMRWTGDGRHRLGQAHAGKMVDSDSAAGTA